jgi:hypothetical protein
MSHRQSIERRTLLTTSGIVATGGLAALAGCTGNSTEPPPRKSNVIDGVELTADGSTLRIDPYAESECWVQSRRDLAVNAVSGSGDQRDAAESVAIPSALAVLSPVGTARAAKGRGATGRGSGGYSSAPRTANGRAWFWGGSYASGWYNDHDDEVTQYPVDIDTLGVAYLGSDARFEEQDPGPGPINWDDTYNSPTDEEIETSIQDLQSGWYRVGANIILAEGPDAGTDLGWECLDLRVQGTADGKEITERWKVSPRI